MSLFSRFRKKPEPVEVDPVEELKEAVDAVNYWMNRLPPELKRVRPFVRSGSRTAGIRPKLLLGYWDMGAESFVVTYEGD